MQKNGQLQHGKILAILFIFYGAAHLLGLSFVWFILLALAAEGYRMSSLRMLGLCVVLLLLVLPPLLSAYSLLREKQWARGVVITTCLTIFMIALVVLLLVSQIRLSTTRLIFAISYGGAILALCLYGISFARKKGSV